MKQEGIIRQYVDLLIQKPRENSENGVRPLDMVRWFNWTAFGIIGDLVFGEPFGCLSGSGYHPWAALIFDTLKHSALQLAAHRLSTRFEGLGALHPEGPHSKACPARGIGHG